MISLIKLHGPCPPGAGRGGACSQPLLAQHRSGERAELIVNQVVGELAAFALYL